MTGVAVRKRTNEVHCPAVATVNAADVVTLPVVPAGAHPVSGHLHCELVAGHDGSHIALVATANDGDQWWWLQWDNKVGQVIQINPCDAELPQRRYADECVLPDGHPGPHSFDLKLPSPLPGNGTSSAIDPHMR